MSVCWADRRKIHPPRNLHRGRARRGKEYPILDYFLLFLSQNSRSQAIPEFSEADNILIVHMATDSWSLRQSQGLIPFFEK